MRYHNRRKKKAFITIVLLCLFIIYGFMIVDRNIRPTVLDISGIKKTSTYLFNKSKYCVTI